MPSEIEMYLYRFRTGNYSRKWCIWARGEIRFSPATRGRSLLRRSARQRGLLVPLEASASAVYPKLLSLVLGSSLVARSSREYK